MTLYCVDTSAWHHASNPFVAHAWRQHLDADELGICDQVRLEVLFSSRSARDYDALVDELGALQAIPMGAATFQRALDLQRQLAHVAGLHHRSVKIADLLIAAAAEAVEAVVWHYDADFDRISAVTSQATEWVARRGSL